MFSIVTHEIPILEALFMRYEIPCYKFIWQFIYIRLTLFVNMCFSLTISRGELNLDQSFWFYQGNVSFDFENKIHPALQEKITLANNNFFLEFNKCLELMGSYSLSADWIPFCRLHDVRLKVLVKHHFARQTPFLKLNYTTQCDFFLFISFHLKTESLLFVRL